MKLRIISDLHLDYNANFQFELSHENIFTIICGDISSDIQRSISWINKNLQSGVFVEGNHIGYNSDNAIQSISSNLEKNYPLDKKISYLNDSYKIVNDIVFVGGILWTDYQLYGKSVKNKALNIAKNEIKDFHCNYIADKNKVRLLQPEDAIFMFHKTLNSIKKVCEKYRDKKIVVITHHAPSIYSIPEKYKNDLSSAAFANNLDDFILNNKNICLWCHGHIHQYFDYKIGQCRVICNPRGYEEDNESIHFDKEFVIEI